MHQLLDHLLDFIFPPKPEEIQIRNLPIDWLLKNGPKAKPTEFPFIISLFSYKDPLIRELIWQIKYKKNAHAIKCAAYSLLQKLPESALLIPIPISKKRRKERGYNQCELLINEIIRQGDRDILSKNCTLLIRSKNIDKQTFKNRTERLENIRGIFKITDEEVDRNQNIVLIDDVLTTGSTLLEARNTLLKAGYNNVRCLTIAH